MSSSLLSLIEGARTDMFDMSVPEFARLLGTIVKFIRMMSVTALVSMLYHCFVLTLIFRKAGYVGWEAWIPIYNTMCLFDMVGVRKRWMFTMLIPLFGPLIYFIPTVIVLYRLPKCFGKSGTWGVLDIFLGTIIQSILAFDKSSQYEGIA